MILTNIPELFNVEEKPKEAFPDLGVFDELKDPDLIKLMNKKE